MMKRLIWIFLCLGVMAPLAGAHRLDLDYWIEDGDLIIEAWTGNDEPVKGGEVTLSSGDGSTLASGETNEDGQFRWKPGAPCEITIEVYAGQGHKKTITLTKDEMIELLEETGAIQQENVQNESVASSEEQEKETAPVAKSPRRSTKNPRALIERILIGFSFIMAAGGFYLALRNSKKIASIETLLRDRES